MTHRTKPVHAVLLGVVASFMPSVVAGCGAVPDVLADSARRSAKQQLDARINEQFDEWADEILDSLEQPTPTPDESSGLLLQ